MLTPVVIATMEAEAVRAPVHGHPGLAAILRSVWEFSKILSLRQDKVKKIGI
jgi:hypothetical protein